MNDEERRRFLAQFDEARKEMDQLSRMFPAWFDKNGKPIIAELRLLPSPPGRKRATQSEFSF